MTVKTTKSSPIMAQTNTLALDRYFGTGKFGIPRVSLTVEEGLRWVDARRQWRWVRAEFYHKERSIRGMEREILLLREAAVASLMIAEENDQQRRYRCRRRLHPIVRRILKENH